MATPKAPESERRPDVIPGDEVFFNHPAGPMSGKVHACGEHGATILCKGTTHKIRWPHILGHKTRASQAYEIEESGEDGHIVRDGAGNRRFLAIPNEAREDPLVAKADKPGGPFAGKPGLQKKVITEKSGKQNTHWVRTNKDQPKGRKPKAPDQTGAKPATGGDDPAQHPHKPGDKVKFKVGGASGEGTLVGKPGPKGGYVQDETGHKHKVEWANMSPAGGPEAPNYEPRNEGESDKEYAKRAIDGKMPIPQTLPEEHDKYFHTDGAKQIPIDKLHSPAHKAGEAKESGENGVRRMQAPYHGKLGKRAPITVMPHPDPEMAAAGHHEIVDGNGTWNSAKNLGWKSLPATVVDRKAGMRAQLEDRAKHLAEVACNPKEFADLPKDASQPWKDEEELYKNAIVGLDQLRDWLNKGKGVASKNGFVTMGKGPDDVTPDEWKQHKGMLFIAGLKKHGVDKDGNPERANEKVEKAYGGDWSKLLDVVRCTLAVDNLHDMADIMSKLKASGMELMKQPKNKFIKPTPQGYRDVNFVVRLPNGMAAEVQLNVKDVLQAKNEGHHFYEITRKIDEHYEKLGLDKDQWAPADREKYDKADAEQQRIYDEAWEKHITSGHYGSDSNMIKSLSRRLVVWTRN